MTVEVPDEIADCECYGCSRNLVNPNEQGSHFTREDPIKAFRCFYCGRLFCPDCCEDHFGPNAAEVDADGG